jgi:hypothetical protein
MNGLQWRNSRPQQGRVRLSGELGVERVLMVVSWNNGAMAYTKMLLGSVSNAVLLTDVRGFPMAMLYMRENRVKR